MKIISNRFIFRINTVIQFSIFICLTSFSQKISLPDELFTRAERTNYEETSLHKDVMDFVTAMEKHSELAHLEIIGFSKQGRDIPLVVMADPPIKTPAEAVKSGKPVIYIQANIHAGEIEGKEACMELMREIAFGTKRQLLLNQIIMFCPIYNADGNDSLSANNRRSQEGSPGLTGIRSSGEGYDLNRDGLKIEALETQALIKNVILKWDPVLFIDLHTTNGSWHGYSLTYAPGNHTAGHPGTTNYLMNKLFPEVRDKVKERSGLDIYLYGNFREWPPERYVATPHRPRFLTNSMALKNKLAILVETFAHDRFEKRILSNNVFLTSILEYTNTHGDEIQELVGRVKEEIVQQIIDNAGNFQKGVQFRIAQLGEPSDLLVYDVEEFVDENGRKRRRRTNRRVWKPNVRMMQRYEPAQMSTVPRGYVFPAELINVADKLKEHGVKVEVLDKTTSFEGEEFIITNFTQEERVYQKHRLVKIEGVFQKTTKEMPAGSFHVDIAQPMAYLVFYMLEPESDDGLIIWNYFDDYLKKNGVENNNVPYPVFKYISKNN